MSISRKNDVYGLFDETRVPTLELVYSDEGTVAVHCPHRILITGAAGQLGRELQLAIAKRPDISADYADKNILDIADADQVNNFLNGKNYTHIINCAAYTAVDRAEKEPETCAKVNVLGAKNLAEAIKGTGTRLIHISTDFVFDGEKRLPYTETDNPHSLSVYGSTKLAGEKEILTNSPDAIIIRTGWLYSTFGRNFVKTIIEKAKVGQPLTVVDDQIGTPTYAADLAQVILDIIEHKKWIPGVYHFSNAGETSWFGFAEAILNLSGIYTSLKPCGTGDYPALATRPAYAVLDKKKITETFGISLIDWRKSLAKCIESLSK